MFFGAKCNYNEIRGLISKLSVNADKLCLQAASINSTVDTHYLISANNRVIKYYNLLNRTEAQPVLVPVVCNDFLGMAKQLIKLYTFNQVISQRCCS